jgi:hypothetical protein
MTLLIFVLAAIAIGYWLSRSKYQQSIDDTASQFASSSQSWTARAENWWKSSVLKRNTEEQFTSWVDTRGQEYLPGDLIGWYSGLPESKRKSFTNKLEANLNKQGFDLLPLLQGNYDNQPARMQVYVEAIVVTSQEFRKTKEVEEPKNTKSDKKNSKPAEKKTAEKQSSRRRKTNPDASEAAV